MQIIFNSEFKLVTKIPIKIDVDRKMFIKQYYYIAVLKGQCHGMASAVFSHTHTHILTDVNFFAFSV